MRGYLNPYPKNGDVRTRTFFAFLPVCTNTEWRWLETVSVREKYHEGSGMFSDWWVKEFIV